MSRLLPFRLPTFIQTADFVRDWADLGLDDDDLSELEALIARRGESAPVVRGAGGLRKIRFAPSRSSRGKSGGVRVGYALFPDFGTILLLTAYTHALQRDIGPGQTAIIRNALEQFTRALKKGKRKP